LSYYSLPAIRLGKVERGNYESNAGTSGEALGHWSVAEIVLSASPTDSTGYWQIVERSAARRQRFAIAKKESLPIKFGQEGKLLPGKRLHAQTQYPPITGAAQLLAEKSA